MICPPAHRVAKSKQPPHPLPPGSSTTTGTTGTAGTDDCIGERFSTSPRRWGLSARFAHSMAGVGTSAPSRRVGEGEGGSNLYNSTPDTVTVNPENAHANPVRAGIDVEPAYGLASPRPTSALPSRSRRVWMNPRRRVDSSETHP